MMLSGLLWFDDDARRPLPQKIAQAATRYRERVGYIPTVVEVNPQQATVTTVAVTPGVADDRLATTGQRGGKRAAKAKGATTVALAKGRGGKKTAAVPVATMPANVPIVRVEPNPTLRPNYFLVGVAAGEQLMRAPEYIAEDDDLAPVTRAAPTPGGNRVAAASTARPRARRAKVEAPIVAAPMTPTPNTSASLPASVAAEVAECVALAPHEHTPAADAGPQPAKRATKHATGRERHTSKPSPIATPPPRAKPTPPLAPTAQPSPHHVADHVATRAAQRKRAAAPATPPTPTPESTLTPTAKRSARPTAKAVAPSVAPASVASLRATPAPEQGRMKGRREVNSSAPAILAPTPEAPPRVDATHAAKPTRKRKTPSVAAVAPMVTPAKAPEVVAAPQRERPRHARKGAAAPQPDSLRVSPTGAPTPANAAPNAKRAPRGELRRRATPAAPTRAAATTHAETTPPPKRRSSKVAQATSPAPLPRSSAPHPLAPAAAKAATSKQRTVRRSVAASAVVSAAANASITQIALPFGEVRASEAMPAKKSVAKSARSSARMATGNTLSGKATQLATVVTPAKGSARKGARTTKPAASVA